MVRSRHTFRCLATLILLTLAAGPGPNTVRGQELEPARPQRDWNQVFAVEQGWCGGDGGGTIVLPHDRVLWLFGDSLIGKLEQGSLAPGSQMVNNAIAIGPRRPPQPATPRALDYRWGPEVAGKPTAWLVPATGVVTPGQEPGEDGKPSSWYWPTGGGCLVSVDGHPRLILFLFHVGSTGKPGVWGFQSVGGALAVVDHPELPVDQWRPRQVDLPHTIDATRVDPAHADSRYHFATEWGLSCLVEPTPEPTTPAAGDAPDWVYIYGTRMRTPPARELLLARARADQVETPLNWQFLAADGQWQQEPARAVGLADGMPSEFSVHAMNHQGQTRFVMVHSSPWLGSEIAVRLAARPEGPWTQPLVIYDVPEVRQNKNFFTYAGRGHAELSPAGRLLVTYAVNGQDFWEMLRNASIYRPHAVELDLDPLWQVALPDKTR